MDMDIFLIFQVFF